MRFALVRAYNARIESGERPKKCVARDLGVNITTLHRWRRAFGQGGIKALETKKSPGRPRKQQPSNQGCAAAQPYREGMKS